MLYKNTKTGALIDIPSKASGGDWEAVGSPKAAPAEKTEEKPETVKKTATRRSKK